MDPHPPHHRGKLREEEFRKERKNRRKETKQMMTNQERKHELEREKCLFSFYFILFYFTIIFIEAAC